MKRFFRSVIDGTSKRALIARSLSVLGFLITVLGLLDRFYSDFFPDGTIGFLLLSSLWANGVLALELASIRRRVLAWKVGSDDVGSTFADGLVRYSSWLATTRPPRDEAVLELRRWATRVLHLSGNNQARIAIGHHALDAAAGLGDQFTQSSVLIDDLGWARIAAGELVAGRENIELGLSLIEAMSPAERDAPEVGELWIKGRRHLIGADYRRSGDIVAARTGLDELRTVADGFAEPISSLNLAQLDHAFASLVLLWMNSNLGVTGRLDRTGAYYATYTEAIAQAKAACRVFGQIYDVEREVKATSVLVGLLVHDGNEAQVGVQQARLTRLRVKASRVLP